MAHRIQRCPSSGPSGSSQWSASVSSTSTFSQSAQRGYSGIGAPAPSTTTARRTSPSHVAAIAPPALWNTLCTTPSMRRCIGLRRTTAPTVPVPLCSPPQRITSTISPDPTLPPERYQRHTRSMPCRPSRWPSPVGLVVPVSIVILLPTLSLVCWFSPARAGVSHTPAATWLNRLDSRRWRLVGGWKTSHGVSPLPRSCTITPLRPTFRSAGRVPGPSRALLSAFPSSKDSRESLLPSVAPMSGRCTCARRGGSKASGPRWSRRGQSTRPTESTTTQSTAARPHAERGCFWDPSMWAKVPPHTRAADARGRACETASAARTP